MGSTSVELHFSATVYDEFMDEGRFEPPSLVVLYNAGVWGVHRPAPSTPAVPLALALHVEGVEHTGHGFGDARIQPSTCTGTVTTASPAVLCSWFL